MVGKGSKFRAPPTAPAEGLKLNMPSLSWDDTENIALALYDKLPEQDPLKVRFTDLHKWITQLDGFSGDPSGSNEGKLEAIQMAWYDEWKENQE
jgi:FeS assembly protein IscX